MRRVTTVLLGLVGILLAGSGSVGASQQEQSKNTIVPGVRVGGYTLEMSKDDVLKRLGEPEAIHLGEDEVVRRGEEKYTLSNLPRRYIMVFGDVSFWIGDDSVRVISVRSPLYKLSNGLGVGVSEQKIKQAFGEDFQPRETQGKDYLCYDAKGLAFQIHQKNQTVAEIVVYQTESDRKELKTLPKYDPDSRKPRQVDLRDRDLTKLDLRKSIEDLMYADFDDRTVWPAPDQMPSDFDWQKIMELGKNPGLGVRSLHEKGITGRGVRVAIIDQPLLVDHQEYAERVRFYEEIDLQGRTEPSMHGAAVASIALGKTVGVAPEAELYYIGMYAAWRRFAKAIYRMLEVNEQLPEDNKIRVISISKGWMPSHEGYKEITEAAQKAGAAGMLIVCSTVEHVHEGFDFGVLGRSPLADPDVFESYEPGLFLAKHFWADRSAPSDRSSPPTVSFSVPMDSRTTASPTGSDKYVFNRAGGFSWAIPYIAGVYALAVQADPAITPERFWALAARTGRTIELKDNGKTRALGPIIDPVRLIRAIQAAEPATLNRQQSDTQPTEMHPQTHSGAHTIVPGVGIGDYTLKMSKDDVLKKLGKPETIHLGEDEVVRRGEEKYSLNTLPSSYILPFGDLSFWIGDDSVRVISVHSPLYKLSNGLGVGVSEQKIKQAFGEDYKPKEAMGRNYLCYDAEGLAFAIDKKSRTVAEIVVYQPQGDGGDREALDRKDRSRIALVRQAAARGRIAFKQTTPDQFKAIAGEPTREWTYDDREVIYMEYPGIEVKFFGKPEMNIPHTVLYVLCEGEGIDIGQKHIVDKGEPDGERQSQQETSKVIMLSEQPSGPITFPKIDRKPAPANSGRFPIHFLGKYDPDSDNAFQVDLRCRDLSKLDLSDSIDDLQYAVFDDYTVWPKSVQMPEQFDPKKMMELGKHPGLGVRILHQRGITGKGVGVAIIDQPLLTEHQEYSNRLRLYEENNVKHGTRGSPHGPAVASIAVGKTVGVAPDADLYYIATWSWDISRDDDPPLSLVFYAQSIRRLLEINRQLPKDRKIRVISMSIGWSPSQDGYDEIMAACDEAKAAGVFVVSTSLDRVYGFDIAGMGRHPLANPDSFESYKPGLFWARVFYELTPSEDFDYLLIPMDSRTTACPRGSDKYVFYSVGGLSWAVPYIAGVYALAVQVDPAITPERFWTLAVQTGRTIELKHNGKTRALGPIIDPVALISVLQKK